MDTPRRVRVIVADDHAAVRMGIVTFLGSAPDIEVVGEARDGREAVDLCARLRPRVILMDLVMPSLDGVAAIKIIRDRCPEVKVIALTSFQDKPLVREALQAGAIGYLLKNVSGEDLAEAIRDACAGRYTLAPEVVQLLIQPEPEIGQDLTAREREVLALLVEGLTNVEIGVRLVVTTATAKAHVGSILAKLGVASRAEAVALALRHKLTTSV